MATESESTNQQDNSSEESTKETIEKKVAPAAEESGKSFGKKFTEAAGKAIKAGAEVLAAAAEGVAELTKSAIENYSNYEQLFGNVETLFGAGGKSLEEYAASIGQTAEEAAGAYNALMGSQQTVIDNAANAFKTAGMSANDYMETVTSFSESLLQGLSGNTQAAADLAHIAITDMADNANKFGTDIETIQEAYQGFAEQNYDMLADLRLGYDGTESEMLRLINDSGILEEEISSLDDVTFDQMIEAIHAVQTDMGITGTTVEEASSTIEGSVNAMKASWENLLTGIADDNADFDSLIDNFISSAEAAGNNIIPRIESSLNGIAELIMKMVPILAEKIPPLIESVLPGLLNAIASLVNGVIAALPTLVQVIADILPGVVLNLINTLINLLPSLLEVGLQAVVTIASGISEAIPELIPALVNMIMQMVDIILNNIAPIIGAVAEIIAAVIVGLEKAIPELLSYIPTILIDIIMIIIDLIPMLWSVLEGMMCDLANFTAEHNEEMCSTITEWLLEDIVPIIVEWGNSVIEKAKEIGANLLSDIASCFAQLSENIGCLIEAVLSIIISFARDIPMLATEGALNFISNFVTFMSQLPGRILEYLSLAINHIATFATHLTAKAVTAASGFVELFSSIIQQLPGQLLNIGADIAIGLWNGMQGMSSWLSEKVRKFASNILGSIKSSLGIHSPSTVFRDEVGKMLDLGLAEGIEGNANVVENALEDLKDVSVGAMDMDMSMNRNVNSSVQVSNEQMSNEIRQVRALLGQYMPELLNKQVVLDSGAVVGQLAAPMDQALGILSIKNARGVLA